MPILQQTEEQYQANVKEAERLGVMNRAGLMLLIGSATPKPV